MAKLAILWNKMTAEAAIPKKAYPSDAGMDLKVLVEDEGKEFAPIIRKKPPLSPSCIVELFDPDLGEKTLAAAILPHSTVVFHTGLRCAIPEGFYLEVHPRSLLGFKQDIMLANTTGIVDCHYRGELMVALHNNSDEIKYIAHGDRVAQCILRKVEDVENIEVDKLDETDRGAGGFGSSGSK